MWISDIYLKLHIDSEQEQRLAEARCAHMTARVRRQQRLLQTLARVQDELDATDALARLRRAPQPATDCSSLSISQWQDRRHGNIQ
jgi:hypothetical protein